MPEHDMNVEAEEEVNTSVRLPPSLPELVKTHNANLPTFCSNDVSGANDKAMEGDYIGCITASQRKYKNNVILGIWTI